MPPMVNLFAFFLNDDILGGFGKLKFVTYFLLKQLLFLNFRSTMQAVSLGVLLDQQLKGVHLYGFFGILSSRTFLPFFF